MPMPASASSASRSSASRPRAAKSSRPRRGAGWSWLHGLIDRRLRIERRGLQIHIFFDKPVAARAAAESGGGSALRRDHLALQALFELRPELRLTMRSLAYLEDAMALRGSRALKGMPPKLYAKALKYLEKAMQMEPGVTFPELERRLREASQVRPVAEVEFTTAVQVTEASHSLFDEMERSWTGEIPPSIFDSRLAEEGSTPGR
jgi:hypothetical protein